MEGDNNMNKRKFKRIVALVLAFTLVLTYLVNSDSLAWRANAAADSSEDATASSSSPDPGASATAAPTDAAASEPTAEAAPEPTAEAIDMGKRCKIELDKTEFTYSGNKIEPKVTVKLLNEDNQNEDDQIVHESNYDVEYPSETTSVSDSSLTVTVKGKGTYTGSLTATYNITAKDLSDSASVEFNPEANSDKLVFPSIIVKDGNTELDASTDYNVTWKRNQDTDNVTEIDDIGEYTAVIEFKGNYTGSIEKPFSIKEDSNIKVDNAFNIDNAVVLSEGKYYYNKNADTNPIEISTKSGYTILRSSAGAVTDSALHLMEKQLGNEITVTVKNDNNNTANRFTFSFVKDTEGPTLSMSDNCGNDSQHFTDGVGMAWSNKEHTADVISVTAEDNKNGIGVDKIYYSNTMGINIAEGINENVWEYIAGSASLEAGKTYYFKAYDKLGNGSDELKVIIPKLDKTAPTISLKKDGTIIDNNTTIYVNKNNMEKPFEFELEISDVVDSSGVNIDSIDADDDATSGSKYYNVKLSDDKKKMTVSPINDGNTLGKSSITIKASDNVGNSSTFTYTLIYDPVAPEISGLQVTDGKKIEDRIVTITKEDVTIKAKITDNDNDGQLSVELITVDENGKGPNVPERYTMNRGDDGCTYSYTVTDSNVRFLRKYYKIVATDKAGNVTESKVIDVDINKQAPVFVESPVAVTTSEGDVDIGNNGVANWVKQDATFKVTVKKPNSSQTTINKFEYQKVASGESRGNTWTEVTGSAITCNEENGAVYTCTFAESDNEFDGVYYFRATDSVGNVSEEYDFVFRKDKVCADTDNIYVTYTKDDDTKAPLGEEVSFYKYMKNIFKNIFAKEKVEVTLYVHDGMSGVASIEYTYGNTKNQKVYAHEVSGGSMTVNIPKNGSKLFNIFTFSIDETHSMPGSHIIINSITDVAGNVVNNSDGSITELKSGSAVIVDAVAPTVEVTYPTSPSNSDDNNQYYNNAEDYERVVFTINETYFMDNVDDNNKLIYPTITYNKNGEGENGIDTTASQVENDKKPYVEWNTDAVTEGAIKATVYLPYDEESADYDISISYEDGSGNQLTSKDSGLSKVSDGKYKTAKKIVLDRKAPTVSIEYPDATKTEAATGSALGYRYYGTDEKTEEIVKLTYTEKYFDSGRNTIYPVIKAIRKVAGEDGEKEITLTAKNSETDTDPYVEWGPFDISKSTIVAEVHIPYCSPANEAEYRIVTTYKDLAGNDLECENDNAGLAKDTQANDDGYISIYSTSVIVLDNKAPEITYSISGSTDRKVNGVDVYKNVNDKNDVKFSITIDDNKDYWNPGEVTIEIKNKNTNETSKSYKGDSDKLKNYWKKDGRKHTVEIGFDGDDAPATYYVTVKYADKAGNKLIASKDNTIGIVDAGVFTSTKFILDHNNPIFEISYDEKATRLVANDKDDKKPLVKNNEVPETGYTAYYNKDIPVTIRIDEDYAAENKEGNKLKSLEDLEIKVNNKNLEEADGIKNDITWSKTGSVYKVEFTIEKEGKYQVSVSYKDAACNPMTVEEENMVQGAETKPPIVTTTDGVGAYTSTTLIIDKTSPVIGISYVDENGNELKPEKGNDNRSYYKVATYLKLTIKDKNLRNKEIVDILSSKEFKAVDVNGIDISESILENYINALKNKEGQIYQGDISLRLPLTTEANYTIPIGVTDLAGNTASTEIQKVTVDTTKPDPENINFSYSVDNKYKEKSVNYKKNGYAFAKSNLTVTASAKDDVAGIKSFTFIITDENGNETQQEVAVAPSESKADKSGESASVKVPIASNVFKGSVKVTVTDWSLNQSTKTENQVVETADKHKETSSAVITTITKPSRTVKGVDYYNTNVKLKLEMKDSYSGIASYSYKAGSAINVRHEIDGKRPKTDEVIKDIELDASKGYNENNVVVTAGFQDNAGHTSEVKQKYNIDITKPVIDVSYDDNNPANEKYYKNGRVATVVITERNFDPKDVKFTITNTEGVMPSISDWKKSGEGDKTRHTAYVTFSEDGDYTFTLEFQDLAGNKAKYGKVDEFTVDKTIPKYSVTYNNNQSNNGYYYNNTRTATIEVDEHNFNAGGITVEIIKDGKSIGSTGMSGWTQSGDINTATIEYSDDADYEFTISGVDMADNPMDPYVTDHFVIDTTEPQIEITGIKNMSANQGTVMPEIVTDDTNYDHYEYTLSRCLEGVVKDAKYTVVSSSASGEHIRFNDIVHKAENDDIYTLSATVYDKAGNSKEVKKIYSVNRFGSNYTYNDETKALVGKNGAYYTKQEQDIVIVETNADILEKKDVTVNLNGNLVTLKENEDYVVEASESDVEWKQYTYIIGKDNFVKEGKYSVVLSSEDRATNTSDNASKKRGIEFVVDKTAPSIQVGGIENGAQYTDNRRNITIAATDNIALKSVSVKVDGTEKLALDANALDDNGGNIDFTLDSKNSEQSLVVTAADAAGNEYTIDAISFLLTTNLWIQYLANKPLLYGSIAAVAALIGGVTGMVFFRRRKTAQIR